MPITALPGPVGVGTLGQESYDFVDFLQRSKQRYWQVLPLTTTSYGDSPYQSFSAFAGNPYLIDVQDLVAHGWLDESALGVLPFGSNPEKIDYAALFGGHARLLEQALPRFLANPPADYARFVEREAAWLKPYAEFMSLKERFGLGAYYTWEKKYQHRGADTAALCEQLSERIAYYQMCQYLFFAQWKRLKSYANKQGVLIIGDMPIYVARDSVEMWANPELFLSDEAGNPTMVAGTPPDQFSDTGQYWGNPIYDWQAMEEQDFSWWAQRLKASFEMFDLVRIDHFRGFESFWAVPFGSETAASGSWEKGPGIRLFDALKRQLGELPIIAEDLGFMTDEVIEMRDATGFPGMKILQFGFADLGDSVDLPHHYTANSVAYAGTHDNETAQGWYEDSATPALRSRADHYLMRAEGESFPHALNRAIAASVSETCIYRAQDLLNLGNEARINTPAVLGGNWDWRMKAGALGPEIEADLKNLTETYFRTKGDTLNVNLNERAQAQLGRSLESLNDGEICQLLVELVRERCASLPLNQGKKRLYYISAEFLVGRLLINNLINLGLYDAVREQLAAAGHDLALVEEHEVEPSLGNGGLGRLAACFLDSIAKLKLPGDGVGLNYHFGLFHQKFVDNQQMAVPDAWLPEQDWLIDEHTSFTIPFGDFTVKSKLFSLDVPGYETAAKNHLRLFDLESVDEGLVSSDSIAFDKGDLAHNLTLFLYPDDSDEAGRLLRVYQEYFMVSNAAQLLIKEAIERGSNLHDLADYAVVQINDTHPTMVIPELIRLLVDEHGIAFDEAVTIVRTMVAYTNHTILAEALEKWPLSHLQKVSPRVAEIIVQLADMVRERLEAEARDSGTTPNYSLYIIEWDTVHMARLAIHFGFSVNGVAALHTKILEDQELAPFYKMYPEKFSNKTNGVTFRRWLMGCNPALSELLDTHIGTDWRMTGDLSALRQFEDDEAVLTELDEAKEEAQRLARNYLLEHQGAQISENAIIDVQIKRIHEYKRQQMLALWLIWKYFDIKNGSIPARPICVVVGGKAAPAYTIAQDVIHLILTLSSFIAADPDVAPHLQVIMLENYNVSVAEHVIPAADISEQISLASKEASGTSNMKFMLNGAVTLCTLDGANVEIAAQVGEGNIYTFGKSSEEVVRLYAENTYNAWAHYQHPVVKLLVDFIASPTLKAHGNPERLQRLHDNMAWTDWFMALLDIEEYIQVKEQLLRDFEDRHAWLKRSLVNIAQSGIFSSDRTISQYNDEIWKLG